MSYPGATHRRPDLIANGSRAPSYERPDMVRINVYMSRTLFRRLRDAAMAREVAVSSVVRELIEAGLERRDD